MELLHDLIGRSRDTVTWWQMSLRAFAVFFFLLLLVRVGGRRAFGEFTSFDIVLAVLLGTVLSRALTGNAPLIPTLCASTMLVLLHALVAKLALRSAWIGRLVKGRELQLVRDGTILRDQTQRSNLTENDLIEALRASTATQDIRQVKAAYLQRNGEISFVLQQHRVDRNRDRARGA